MDNEIINDENVDSVVSKVEKVDLQDIKFEQDRAQFYEKIDKMINDTKFVNDCKKYLEIKKNQKD